MSVYSGFATRSLERAYNKNLVQLVQLLQSQLITFMKGDPLDVDSWVPSFSRIYSNLQSLERQKYLEPKFSRHISELAEFMHIKPTGHQESLSKYFINLGDFTLPILDESYEFKKPKTSVRSNSVLKNSLRSNSVLKNTPRKPSSRLSSLSSKKSYTPSPVLHNFRIKQLPSMRPNRARQRKYRAARNPGTIYQEQAFHRLGFHYGIP